MATKNRNSANSTQTATNGSTYLVGLDIGYGITKAITTDRPPIMFPSIAGHARSMAYGADELLRRYPGDQLTDDSGKWFVGDLAASQLTPGELNRLRGRTAAADELGNEFRVRMMIAALGKLFAGTFGGAAVHVMIATGLPVSHMNGADTLKSALLGQHAVKTDSADFIADVLDVAVMPQPNGCLYSQMLTVTGAINKCHTATRTGVLDIGTYTTDATLDDDGEFIGNASGSVEFGISDAQERISALLETAYGEKPTYKAVENTLRTGCYTAFGQEVDYSDDVNAALDPLRSAVMNLLSERWHTGSSIDIVYLAGGGAPLLIDLVQESYPQAELVKDPQMANARGYLQYALNVSGAV